MIFSNPTYNSCCFFNMYPQQIPFIVLFMLQKHVSPLLIVKCNNASLAKRCAEQDSTTSTKSSIEIRKKVDLKYSPIIIFVITCNIIHPSHLTSDFQITDHSIES